MNSLYAILLLIPLSLPGQFFRRDGEPAKHAGIDPLLAAVEREFLNVRIRLFGRFGEGRSAH